MTGPSYKQAFQKAVKPNKNSQKKFPPPFSIRFTEDERARLNRDAGTLSLAAYIRLKLFCESEKPTSKRFRTRKPQQPNAEHVVLSHMLGGLGKSRMASNLNQIAKAANIGALPLTPELLEEVNQACAAIQHMRRLLIVALGVKAEDGE